MGNGVVSKAVTLTELEQSCLVVAPYHFFNNINNGQPYILIDFRKNPEDVLRIRLKNSLHLTVDQLDNLSSLLEPWVYPHGKSKYNEKLKGVRYFAFLLSSDVTEEERNLLSTAVQSYIHSLGGKLCKEVPRNAPKIPLCEQDPIGGGIPEVVIDSTVDNSTLSSGVVTAAASEVQVVNTASKQDGVEIADSAPTLPAADPTAEIIPAEDDSQLHVIVSILFNCETFFQRYAACNLAFDRGDTGSQPNTYRTKYYASEIIPDFLFLGDYQNATEADQLQALGITHIVDATFEHLSEDAACKLKLCYLPVDVWDTETADIKAFFPASNNFITAASKGKNLSEDNSKDPSAVGRDFSKLGDLDMIQSSVDMAAKCRVLVHCRAGWSRSPTLVVAFLMHQLSLSM